MPTAEALSPASVTRFPETPEEQRVVLLWMAIETALEATACASRLLETALHEVDQLQSGRFAEVYRVKEREDASEGK